jgi:hypothetical protein
MAVSGSDRYADATIKTAGEQVQLGKNFLVVKTRGHHKDTITFDSSTYKPVTIGVQS